jgi:hypothetical protein
MARNAATSNAHSPCDFSPLQQFAICCFRSAMNGLLQLSFELRRSFCINHESHRFIGTSSTLTSSWNMMYMFNMSLLSWPRPMHISTSRKAVCPSRFCSALATVFRQRVKRRRRLICSLEAFSLQTSTNSAASTSVSLCAIDGQIAPTSANGWVCVHTRPIYYHIIQFYVLL